jgi:hypothetical protein
MLQKIMKKIITTIIVTITLLPLISYAAVVHVVPAQLHPNINTPFKFTIEVMPQNDSINAVEGTIIIPAGLKISSINDAASIISLWVDRPHLDGTHIIFSGVIPGGYQSERGELFSIVAEATHDISSTIDLTEVHVLQNDGNGTPAIVTVASGKITTGSSTTETAYSLNDTIPPEPFTPLVSQDPNLYDGKYFVVFTTQDKQSGINHYEVKEDKTWVTTTSPYLLTDQTRAHTLYIKAVDNAGNERLETVSGLYTAETFLTYLVWGILGLLLIIGLVYFYRREK